MIGRTSGAEWRAGFAWLVLIILTTCGCSKQPVEESGVTTSARHLSDSLQGQVQTVLLEQTGAGEELRLPADPDTPAAQLLRGQRLYQNHCRTCHGQTGDGAGPAARYLNPRPRDFRSGLFKYKSTDSDAKPLAADLQLTIRFGVPGTAMIAFWQFDDEQLEALAAYIMLLAQRGELERLLVLEAEAEGELDAEYVAEYVDEVRLLWNEAESRRIEPRLPPQGWFEPERIEAGRRAFRLKGCTLCHGAYGRGQVFEAPDAEQGTRRVRAPDLTARFLRSRDIYNSIYYGVNGTSMPGYGIALQSEPDTLWDLTAYVSWLSEQRRNGKIFEADAIAPIAVPPAAAGRDNRQAP